jgi:hypothetical protein
VLALVGLPGGGAGVTSPVAGPQPEQVPSRLLPPIPPGSTTTPGTALVTPLPSELGVGDPAGPTDEQLDPTRPAATPTPQLAERPGPSGPPVTQTPPGRTPSPTPTATPPTPSDPPTTPDDPDDPDKPEPRTIGEVLRELAELLTP